MSLVISEDIVQASGLSEKELVLELIILLFERKKIRGVRCFRDVSFITYAVKK
jgi:hypothetical protein